MERQTQSRARALALLAGLATLAACGEQGSGGQWYREAGAQLDSGEFGNATMQNIVAQTCFPGGRGSAFPGGKIARAAADPVVVPDPTSTPANPVYRVHCTGRLDGKYAQVVYNDYVASAGQVSTVTTATGE